ncbi:MAG: hypothetical protein ABJB97_05755 [Acidobacteriota bacterium]
MANRIVSFLGMMLALTFAVVVALGLGVAAYALTAHGVPPDLATGSRASRAGRELPSVEFVFFSVIAFCYLMWATLPLSIGSNRQFDPGRLLLYPISLRKLFAFDFISETVSLQSIFAVPAIMAISLGAGLGRGMVSWALLAGLVAVAFGLALSKWLSISVGSLLRRKRTRGETLLALIGVCAGLGGALVGQLAPAIFRHADSFTGLRWTPPGAAAFALTGGLRPSAGAEYVQALATLGAYTIVLVVTSYWIARRAALGSGGAKRNAPPKERKATPIYTGWELPGLSAELSAVIEKELRYVLRNAQLRMMVLMPLILIVIRLVNTNRLGSAATSGRSALSRDFLAYGFGLMATAGVLYVFLILTGLSSNHFAFEEGGMRALILSPVDRRKILVGKNIAITCVALVFASALLLINELVFGDVTAPALLFAALSFVTFAAITSIVGNWLSIRFPKRMKFGKRLNVSGVVGLLLIPILILLALPPLAATAAGYLAQSRMVEYATLALLAVIAIGFYGLLISAQGRALEQREVEILDAVREPIDD